MHNSRGEEVQHALKPHRNAVYVYLNNHHSSVGVSRFLSLSLSDVLEWCATRVQEEKAPV